MEEFTDLTVDILLEIILIFFIIITILADKCNGFRIYTFFSTNSIGIIFIIFG
jgi:hypothetical protein